VRPVVTDGWTTPWNRLVAAQSRAIDEAFSPTSGAARVHSGEDGVANIALVATLIPTG
jgi:hypothetical protein